MQSLNTPSTPQIKPSSHMSNVAAPHVDFSKIPIIANRITNSQSEGAIPPLGIRTKIASTNRKKVVNDRFQLQASAACLMPKHRVAGCLRDLAMERVSIRGQIVTRRKSHVEVMYSPSVESAHFKGLVICGSVWDCPVCAAKITELRRQELTMGMNRAKELGFYPVLVTYTQRHKKHQKCKSLLNQLNRSRRKFKAGRGWQQIAEEYGFVGSVRSKETTYTIEHGWHIHTHEEMLFDHTLSALELAKLTLDLKRRWTQSADADWKHGLDVQVGHAAINNYIAKFGVEPQKSTWTLEHEIAKSGVKKASPNGRTPFGLLEAYNAGDVEAGELFKEYSAAFKGQRQLWWTKGLRELLGLNEVEATDEELAESEQAAAVVVLSLNIQQWRVVVGNDARAELLEVVTESKGDPDAVWLWLAEIGIEREGIDDG